MPDFPPVGVTKHTDLTDKEVAGIIDHANLSVSDGKLASGVGLNDGQILKLPAATEGQALVRGPAAWAAGDIPEKQILKLMVRLAPRMSTHCLAGYLDPYVWVRASTATVATEVASIQLIGKVYGCGVYQWNGKLSNTDANFVSYLFAFEKVHGWLTDGILALRWNRVTSAYESSTTTGGNQTVTTLVGQNWTVERIFKVDWDSTPRARFYVDGGLVSTHTTNVPPSTDKLTPFMEVYSYGNSASPYHEIDGMKNITFAEA